MSNSTSLCQRRTQYSMIVALEPIEFIPCGRYAIDGHPGLGCLHLHRSQAPIRLDKSLVGSFSQVTLEEYNKDAESWILRMRGNTEEELYIHGHVVIWSRGNKVLSTYTIDTPVMQAMWCSFSTSAEHPHVYDLDAGSVKGREEMLEGVAIVSEGSLHVFTKKGEDYITALPFHVRKVWNSRFGMILERSSSKKHDGSNGSEAPLPELDVLADGALTTVFCLQHPLREFAPVVKKYQGQVSYMNHTKEVIVFCEDDIVMTFESKHGLHMVWTVREITSADSKVLGCNANKRQNLHNQSPVPSPKPAVYMGSPAGSVLHGVTGMSGLGIIKTPHSGRNISFSHVSNSPSSRHSSPAGPSMNHGSHMFSPILHSPRYIRSPSTPISHESLCLSDSVHESAEPLRPEICLEHAWSEGITGTREGMNVGMATRAFLTTDVCGQSFLAYHIDSLLQLRLVKCSISNDCVKQLIFGVVTTIPARDAVPLKAMNMLALLDMAGTIALYTGVVKVVKMHISGIPMSSLSLSHGFRNPTPSMGTPQPVSTPAHPSRPSSMLGSTEEVSLLSPVPELAYRADMDFNLTVDEFTFAGAGYSPPILSVPQVIGSGLLLELSNGSHFRSEVPSFCTSSLVQMCMEALGRVLPGDMYMQLMIRWYAMRHSPGSMASCHSEWAMLEICLRHVTGCADVTKEECDADNLASPVVATKKARHFEEGNSNDWSYLLDSDFHHKQSGLLSRVGGNVFSEDLRGEKSEPKASESQVRSNAHSSPNWSSDRSFGAASNILSSMFSALHAVYEEQKLNILTQRNVLTMSRFLQQLANDLGLDKFSRSYAMDDPALIADAMFQVGASMQHHRPSSRISAKLAPNAFVALGNLLKDDHCSIPFPVISGVTERARELITVYDFLSKNDLHEQNIVEIGSFRRPFFRQKKGFRSNGSARPVSRATTDSREFRTLLYMVEVGMSVEYLRTLPEGICLPILNQLRRCKMLPNLNLPNDALKLIGRMDVLKRNCVRMKRKSASSFKHPEMGFASFQLNLRSLSTADKEHENFLSGIFYSECSNGNNTEPARAKPVKSHCAAETRPVKDIVTRLLFPYDHRVPEVQRMLQSSKPVKIDLNQQAGVSDHDFSEQTKTRLYQLCNRTMALAVGRGMACLQTAEPSITSPFRIPDMDLTGRGMPGNTSVTLEGSGFEVPPNMKDWPLFHNGVAAGLKIIPQDDNSPWIYLNKPKSNVPQGPSGVLELSPEHAGFLLALGLSGHLEKLHKLNVHDYLSQTHEMTTTGLLLGLGASKCGTCDLTTMRLLSVHVPALLPPTSTEFDMPQLIQTAAVSAIGFLYLGSAHRLVAEVMLREIDRPLGSEYDSSHDREAYALSCGLALGAITLGQGGDMPELVDLNIPDVLYHYMTGKKKRAGELSTQSVILEGDQINTEVTAPGAILAIALMFLKTNNMAIAKWFSAPETLLQLEAIKPQHLMLRTLGQALVLWDFIVPSNDWVECQIPVVVRNYIKSSRSMSTEETIDGTPLPADAQTILQCHASALTGACLALGIRFAGSQNKGAYQTLHHYVHFFLSIWDEQGGGGSTTTSYPQEVMGRYMLETCLTATLIALSMVVAGSGDLKTLQICRFLHTRVGVEINYGMQMATHMALGFLFLGGCRQTLCTTNKAIVALLASVYPCFPCSTSDNQYHLQALRHFYVLACERRLLVPVDAATDFPCYARITVELQPMPGLTKKQIFALMAPCMLPEIGQLKQVTVDDPRHWPLSINVQEQPSTLPSLLRLGMIVQRKIGNQPYSHDPQGHRSLLARSSGFALPECTSFFTDDVDVNTFSENFLAECFRAPGSRPSVSFASLLSDKGIWSGTQTVTGQECKSTSHLVSLLRNLVTREHSKSVYVHFSLQQMCHEPNSSLVKPLTTWQLKLVTDYLGCHPNRASSKAGVSHSSSILGILCTEMRSLTVSMIAGMESLISEALGLERKEQKRSVQCKYTKKWGILHLSGVASPVCWSSLAKSLSLKSRQRLAAFVVYNDISAPFILEKCGNEKDMLVARATGSVVGSETKMLLLLCRHGIRPPAAICLLGALTL